MKAPPSTIIVEKPQAVEQLQNSSANQAKEETKTSFFTYILNKPKRGEDYGILQALLSIDMLIIFFSTLVGLGSGLTVVDNMEQIREALGYEPKTIKTFTSLISISNYAGRVFSGFLSETLLRKYKVPRPVMLSAVLFLTCIGHLHIAFPFKGSVYLASLIIGFTLGAQLPLVLSIISEIFGLKHYSTLFNCGQVAIPVGSYLLNKELTGRLYDREATKFHAMDGSDKNYLGKPLVCVGKQCFGLSFKIITVAVFFGALISLILVARTLEFYKRDIHGRYRGESDTEFSDEKKETTEMISPSDNEAK
jgi:MFS family permease